MKQTLFKSVILLSILSLSACGGLQSNFSARKYMPKFKREANELVLKKTYPIGKISKETIATEAAISDSVTSAFITSELATVKPSHPEIQIAKTYPSVQKWNRRMAYKAESNTHYKTHHAIKQGDDTEKKPFQTKATLSFIFSLLGITSFLFIFFISGLLAVFLTVGAFFSLIAITQAIHALSIIKATEQRGKGLAITGLVLGGLIILLSLALLILLVLAGAL